MSSSHQLCVVENKIRHLLKADNASYVFSDSLNKKRVIEKGSAFGQVDIMHASTVIYLDIQGLRRGGNALGLARLRDI